MPSGLAAGPHTVTFTGTGADGNAVSRIAYLTVSDTGTVTYLSYTAAESLTLAETGFEVVPLGAAALLLLAAGVALTLRRRRVIA
jgi:LPXTG-motif cell wall-anchored protein